MEDQRELVWDRLFPGILRELEERLAGESRMQVMMAAVWLTAQAVDYEVGDGRTE